MEGLSSAPCCSQTQLEARQMDASCLQLHGCCIQDANQGKGYGWKCLINSFCSMEMSGGLEGEINSWQDEGIW